MNQLKKEIETLKKELNETKETLEAIRTGAVDAIVVEGNQGVQVFTLKGADHSYRILIESMNEGAMTLSEDGIILYSNISFSKLIQTPLEQIVGANFESFVDEKSLNLYKNVWKLAKNKEVKKEIILKQDDHSFIPVLLSFSIAYQEDHKYICLVVTDLTDQKQTVEILQRETELKRKNNELIRLNQNRHEFTSMVTHELRTPLIAIREGITMILEGVDGPITPEQRETLTVTKNNVDRLDRFVENVLSFSSMEAGKIIMNFSIQNLNEVVSDICKFMSFAVKKNNLDFKVKLPSEKIIFSFDSDAVRHILTNLIHNSIKFTPSPGFIQIILEDKNDFASLMVQDSGIGIKKEDQEKIFEMFQMGEQSDLNQINGSGIGLAVCKKLAEAHQGSIEVKSNVENGTTFTVLIKKNNQETIN